MTTTCPVCNENTLSFCQLEANLSSSQCSKCGGVWISASQYEQWLKLHGENLAEKSPEEGVNLVSEETPKAKFCPDCKYILIKYKVGHDVGFSLNRCDHCGGIWFDKNEWQIMKSRNLHDDVHRVFSQAWQSVVRAEEHKAAMNEILRNQLGEADLNEIRRIKTWLQTHPKSAELYAYLLSDKDNSNKSRSVAGALSLGQK
jgi:Zn-finger nucleic acid-binding protein